MSKDYGQFCGLARATQVLGERWALLVVRDLMIGPRRFKDLQTGLPGIPTTVLTKRLRELEEVGAVERRPAPSPARGVLYALTPYGTDLTPILDALGRWGARHMDTPRPTDVVTNTSLAAALHAAYQPGVLKEMTTFLIHSGPATAWATADGDEVTVGAGQPATAPDLRITAGPEMRALLAGALAPGEALASGVVTIEGDRTHLENFTHAFHVPLDVPLIPRPITGAAEKEALT